ncbi:hypothetical protein KGA66_13585 [Actinocrinis puniceicyclus]|uniref:CBM3 domain-containing protein n=1 Tax=Actinocrinis puniceicyclus TaxID=977794 RepID=A0A8J7WRK7_9ACTN|nr:cellulose binding domain-containing protein [Actinocrinis puniceicyclus]MBS2964084.1 hypothetical protein [Actinocrinis puniceicyclus]
MRFGTTHVRTLTEQEPNTNAPRPRRRLPALIAGSAILLQAMAFAGAAHAASGISGDGGKAPGDPNIAVGRSDIVEVVNSQIAMWAKTNTSAPLLSESVQAFLGTAAGANNCGDTEIQYLPVNQRWVFTCTNGTNGAADYGVSVAISQTSDPTGAWYRWIGQAQTGMPFLDAPKPLATTDKLMVYGGPDTGDSDVLYVYPLADALSGTLDAPVSPTIPNGSQRRFTHKAAVYQNSASVTADGYFVGNGCSDLGCGFDVLKVSGTAAAPTVTATFAGADTAPALPSANPVIPGGTADAQLFGTGVINAVMESRTSDGHQVMAFSGQQGCASYATRYCTYRDVYDLTNGQLTQSSSGQPAVEDHLLGSVGVDAAGNLYDSYLYSNSATEPSAGAAGPTWYASMAQSDATSGTSGERYGDYYDAVQDPSDGTKMWFVSAYQTGSDEFGWSTSFGCGTAAGYGCAAPVTTGPKSQYLDTSAAPQVTGIQPVVQLVNTAAASVSLSHVRVRYWFTHDNGATTYAATCDYAVIGCANVTENVVNLSAPLNEADAYLEVGFTSGAGTLNAGASTGQIQLRFNKTDWSSFTQTNDFSYGTNSAFQDSPHITVYVDGTLVWGVEPS